MKRWQRSRYLIPGRLEDVLALIQVLALDEHVHRSDDGLESELQGPPQSDEFWTVVAEEHPEFFRVAPDAEHGVSLIARHVAQAANGSQLPADYASKLLKLAVDLHDRELRRSQQWQPWIPFVGTVVAGVFTLLAVLLGAALRGS